MRPRVRAASAGGFVLLLAFFGGASLVACRSTPETRIDASDVELSLGGVIQTPDTSPPVPSTTSSPNHWRRRCGTFETARQRRTVNGTLLEERVTIPQGDWVVVTLELEGTAPVLLFDGRLQALITIAPASSVDTNTLMIAAALPTLPLVEPTCSGLVVTVHGAQLSGTSESTARFEGATLVDADARLFRTEVAWWLVPDEGDSPE